MSNATDTDSLRPHSPSIAAPHAQRGLAMLLGLIGAGWLLAIVTAGTSGWLDSGLGQTPLALLLAIAVPPALFLLAYRASATFHDFVLGLDLRLLTAVQTWRVIGGMFLFLYALDLRPALFALPAGLGDMAVGVAAVFVLRSLLDGHPRWRRRVWLLNFGGLLDFVAAIATGVLTSNSSLGFFAPATPMPSMGAMPLCLIPGFLVPLWVMVHFASLLQLRATRR